MPAKSTAEKIADNDANGARTGADAAKPKPAAKPKSGVSRGLATVAASRD